MEDNRQRVEARINEELFRYFGSGEPVTCSHAETLNVEISIVCQWELWAQEVVERYTGEHHIGEMFADDRTAAATAQEYIEQIKNGDCQSHSTALWDFIHNNRLEAVWDSSYKLEDDRQLSSIVVCGTCAGKGQVTCANCAGKGRVICFRCGGRGEVDCSGCHGSGRTSVYDGQRTVLRPCGSCGGGGRVRCGSWSCRGGKVTCSTCSGKGLLACKECSATGCFTITRTFTVSGVIQDRTISHQRDTPDWINQYISEAVNNPDTHPLPLEQTIGIYTPDIRFNTDYPYVLEAPGTLPATRATVSGADEAESRCELFGEALHPYDLGMVGDYAGSHLARQVLSNMTDMEKLQPLLQQKIYRVLLPLRHNAPTDITSSYPFRIHLLSDEAGNNLLSAYHAVVETCKKARSIISIKSWLGLSAVWIFGIFILLTLINSIYIGQLDWGETGFTANYYWQDIWEEAQSKHPGVASQQLSNFIVFLEGQPPPFFLHLSICVIAGYCLAKMFFLVQRALTFLRFTGEVLIGATLGCVIFLLFQPAFSRVTAVTVYPPGSNELIAGAVMSLSLVLEVVVLGFFSGLFHSRRNIDRRIRQQIRNNSIIELEQDLGYAKQS